MPVDPVDLSWINQNLPEPSTLYLFWADREPPLEEEIRLCLQQSWEGCAQKEPLEPSGPIRWGASWSFPENDAEMLIWAEDRDTCLDDLLDPEILSEEARQRALDARWVIGVETFLDAAHPQQSFQFQLRVLSSLALPGLVAVHDGNAHMVRAGDQIEDLAAASVPPRANTLYAIHTVEERGGLWLHTHGLDRVGLAELDLVGLSRDRIEEGFDLIDAVVDALLGGSGPTSSGTLVLGDGLEVRFVGVDTANSVLPQFVVGGADSGGGDDASHGGHRLIILDPVADEPPNTALSRLAEGGIVYKSHTETVRLSALSRERWGTFGLLFAMHRKENWRFHTKMAWPRHEALGEWEHLWLEVLRLEPGRVKGRLLSAPADVPALVLGDEVWHSLDHLTDWVVITPQGPYDPEVAPLLLAEH